MSCFVSVARQTGLNTETQLAVSVSAALEERPATGTDEMLANFRVLQFVNQELCVISKFTQNLKANLSSINQK